MKNTKKIALSVLAASTLVLTGCSLENGPDEQTINYNHAPGTAPTFSQCYGPSEQAFKSPTDENYKYPAGQRVYAFQVDGGDGDIFNVTTKDGVSLGVEGAVRFALTGDCETLQKFHERVGLRMKAYEDEGWVEFLRVYLRAPINRALTDATQGRNWMDIYGDPKAKAEWEKEVSEKLPSYVAQTIGGDYVGDFAVTLQKPVLPEQLEKALLDTQTAVQENRAQEERNAKISTEMDSIKELTDVLGVDGYLVYEAIKSGKVNIMPVGDGADVIIDGGGKAN